MNEPLPYLHQVGDRLRLSLPEDELAQLPPRSSVLAHNGQVGRVVGRLDGFYELVFPDGVNIQAIQDHVCTPGTGEITLLRESGAA